MIFVFGSNLAGHHGAGAAREAADNWGAIDGVGEGHTGQSYAIPTKDEQIKTLPIARIKTFVDRFIKYAVANPSLYFVITRVGCGLAGYKDKDIAPLFHAVPENCHIPATWARFIRK